jgi:hypothetical protein
MALPREFPEAGISTAIPGQYVRQNFPAEAGGAGTGRTPYVIGSAAGGVPYNADVPEDQRRNLLGTASDAADLLRSGPGRHAVEFTLDPTPEEGFSGPPAVGFIRVDPAVQATSDIKDGAAAVVIELKTGRYGSLANQVARRIEAGTSVGYRVTTKFLDDTREQDDVSLELINMQYVGTGTSADLAVDGTNLTVSVGGTPADSITLALADYERTVDLANYMNDLPAYVASIAGTSTESPLILDLVSGIDIKASSYAVSANVEAVARHINRNSGGELIAEVVGDRKALAYDSAFVFCAGGTSGTPSLSDWLGALELAEKFEDLRVLIMPSASESYQTAGTSHVREMSSTINGLNRQLATGADLLMTDSDQKERARALGNGRVEFFGTPYKRLNTITGEVQEWEPFYAAASVVGLRLGAEVTTSAEFKRVIGTGVTRRYKRTEAEQLVRAGVSLLEPGPGGSGVQVMADVTCHQGDRTVLTVPSMLYTADEISLDVKSRVRARIAPLREAGSPVVVAEFENWIRSALLPSQVEARRAIEFSDVQFRVEGDAWTLNFTCRIPAPIRFFFSVQNFLPWISLEIAG